MDSVTADSRIICSIQSAAPAWLTTVIVPASPRSTVFWDAVAVRLPAASAVTVIVTIWGEVISDSRAVSTQNYGQLLASHDLGDVERGVSELVLAIASREAFAPVTRDPAAQCSAVRTPL